jgi:hypothetical protein
VFVSQRELEIDSGQEGEDVGLQNGNEDLEARPREAEREGSDSDELECSVGVEEEEVGCQEEQHEKQVADDHVHEQSKGQRDRAKHEGRDELDRCNDDVQRPRNPGREERVTQERARVLAESRVDEGHVRDHRKDEGQTDERRACDVRERHDAREVHRDHNEEDRGQQRQEALAILLAEKVNSDGAWVAKRLLDESLEATRHNLHAGGADREYDEDDHEHHKADDHDAVHLERRADEENGFWEELSDRWALESAIAAVVSCDESGYFVESVM